MEWNYSKKKQKDTDSRNQQLKGVGGENTTKFYLEAQVT